jgi:SAM-dependent methyltransferase
MSKASLKRFLQDVRAELMLKPRVKNIIRHLKKKEGLNILDIGCGNGQALLTFKKLLKDCRVHGVDFGASQKELLEGKGIIFYQGDFASLQLSGSYFDVITLIHSIEHFIDPAEVIRKALNLLAPGGILYLETHRAGCLEQRIYGPYWIGFDGPRHLTVFTDNSLEELLNRSGCNIISLDKRLMSLGDIIYSLRRFGLSKTDNKIMNVLVSDRNPALLVSSFLFNIFRRFLFYSSVVGLVVKKKGQ